MRYFHRFSAIVSFISVLIILPCGLLAQPSWVKDAIKSADTLNLPDKATYVVLYKSSKCKISSDASATTEVRFAVKILKSTGTDAAILTETTTPTTHVDDLHGWHIDTKGKTEKLDEDNIIEIGKFEDAGSYDDIHILRAGFTGVGTGDIVAYEYKVKESLPWDALFQHFVFQLEQPVLQASFEMDLPDGWDIHYAERYLGPITHTQDGNHHIWQSRYLDLRPDEPFMPPWREVARAVLVQCFSTVEGVGLFSRDWSAVSQWALQQMPLDTLGEADFKSLVDSLTRDAGTAFDSIRTVADWVRDEVRYVAVEMGEGRFQPRPAGVTLANRYGDCKDKVALERAMLSCLGIQSWPVLAMTGGPVDPSFPSPLQFNHCILAIPVAADSDGLAGAMSRQGDWVYFDPTFQASSLGNIPVQLTGSVVLPLGPEMNGPVALPTLAPEARSREIKMDIDLSQDGSITARVEITCYGLAAEEDSFDWRRTAKDEMVRNWQERLTGSLQNVKITEFDVHPGPDSATMTLDLTGNVVLTAAGELILTKFDLLSPDLISLPKDSSRCFPISFGRPGRWARRVVWNLPQGWTLAQPIKPCEVDCGIARVMSSVSPRENGVEFEYSVTYNGGQLPPEKMPEAKTFIESVQNIANTYLVMQGN